MLNQYNLALLAAAIINAGAAMLHILCVVGGAPWYRRFGAGERIAMAAAQGHWYPAIITSGIALMLAVWTAYTLAGAGIISQLPFMKLALSGIAVVYLLRGLAVLPLLVIARNMATPFVVWSSVLCFAFGTVHLLGLSQVWSAL